MKVWRYYLKPRESKELDLIRSMGNVSVSDLYPLFAMTADKKMKTKFEDVWDTSKFLCRKSHMSKEEYEIYRNRHKGAEIRTHTFIGCANSWEHGDRDLFEEEFPVTFMIIQHVTENDRPEYNQDLWVDDFNFYLNPDMVKEKYLRALSLLGYTSAYGYFSSFTRNEDVEIDLYDRLGSIPDFTFNEIAWFLKSYSDLLKI